MWFAGKSMSTGKGKYYPPPIVPGCRFCSKACIAVTDIFLVDSTNDIRLFPIEPGEFLDFDFLESYYGVTEFSVECVASGDVGSMLLTDNFGTQNLDNDPPFILAGDNLGDFFDSNFRQNPGTWRVTCQPFCEDNGFGEAGPLASISFVVGPGGPPQPSLPPAPLPTRTPLSPSTPAPSCDSCRAGCINVVDFVLVDARTDTKIRSLVPGGECPARNHIKPIFALLHHNAHALHYGNLFLKFKQRLFR